jgi:hypothetical protein
MMIKCRGFSPFGISYYTLCFGGAISIFAITVYLLNTGTINFGLRVDFLLKYG